MKRARREQDVAKNERDGSETKTRLNRDVSVTRARCTSALRVWNTYVHVYSTYIDMYSTYVRLDLAVTYVRPDLAVFVLPTMVTTTSSTHHIA